MIKKTIANLLQGQTPDQETSYQVMKQIMAGQATPAQIAGYLIALRFSGETAALIAGSARAMREACTPITTNANDIVDTCGTGGDGADTFNISTAAALVTAAAGVPVAKHGNRSVSSKSGSADVLTALGVNINISPKTMTQCLNQIGIAFLFAPSLHPAMKHAIAPRKELGIRTLFNILGPLTNPASAQRGVLGVFNADLVPLVAHAAAKNGAKHLLVVHGNDGLDEITTTTSTHIAEVKNTNVNLRTFHPDEVGLPTASPDDLKGGGPQENAAIIQAILKGQTGPCTDIVALNAAAAILAGNKANDLSQGLTLAQKALSSGKALQTLNHLITATNA